MKKVMGITAGLVLAFAVIGCAKRGDDTGAIKPLHIRFANVTADSAVFAGEEFKRIAEAASEGTLIIDHFPRNQLGNDFPVVEATIAGDIDIAVSSTSSIVELYRDLYIFDAPYMFLDTANAYKRLDSVTGKKILDGMASKGLKGLTLWENGFRNYTNNKVAVRLPSDIRGHKVRAINNDIHLAMWKAFGASPVPMAFNELFTALQQGAVDAQENPLGIIDANRFQDVQKYVSLTQHVYTPFIVVMNLDKYKSLTPVQQAAIDKAALESTTFQREISQSLEGEILRKFQAQGITVIDLTPTEKAAWQKSISDNKIFDMVKGKMDHPEYVDEMLK
jgi:tripartite ATP-independent transporter DctP family solute receptor